MVRKEALVRTYMGSEMPDVFGSDKVGFGQIVWLTGPFFNLCRTPRIVSVFSKGIVDSLQLVYPRHRVRCQVLLLLL